MPEREILCLLCFLSSALLHFQYVESIIIYLLIVTYCDDLYMFSEIFLSGSKYLPEVISHLVDTVFSCTVSKLDCSFSFKNKNNKKITVHERKKRSSEWGSLFLNLTEANCNQHVDFYLIALPACSRYSYFTWHLFIEDNVILNQRISDLQNSEPLTEHNVTSSSWLWLLKGDQKPHCPAAPGMPAPLLAAVGLTEPVFRPLLTDGGTACGLLHFHY